MIGAGTHQAQVNELVEAIKKKNGKPINAYVVAATIESLGIREIDVPLDYGFESITDLAASIFKFLNTPEYYTLKNESQVVAERRDYDRISINAYLHGRTGLFFKDYSTGIFHLLPVALQIAAVIVFGFSLWTYVGFNDLQSTAVVLGVILGLVATGGFVQAIGKQVSFYWYNEDYSMTHKTIKKFFMVGLKSMLVLFGSLILLNSFIRLYPFTFVVITFIYAFFIGALLLALAPMYTIKRRWMISVAVLIGTLLALSLHWFTRMEVYLIHWTGIVLSTLIALGFIHYFLKKKIDKTENNAVVTPKNGLAIYRNIDYFLYGSLIYVFVFTDRILAWSSTAGRELPYVIYYEPKYEIGMDLAILVFFLLAGVMEYSISSFSRFLEYHQRTTRFNDMSLFNDKMRSHYRNHLLLFIGSGVVVFFILYGVTTKDWGYVTLFNSLLDPMSARVCAIGSLGYLFLSLGMLNVLYMFTLNKHKKPVIYLAVAMVVNVLLGLVLSRWISYEYAALGFSVASLVFAVLTTRATFAFFKSLDYHYYAAY